MGAIGGLVPRRMGESRERLQAAAAGIRDAMDRRAPVEGGMAVAYDGSVALVHRGGVGPGSESVLQPLSNETGTLWLVADGDPTNATDLRLELVALGHRFQSACASEVILHLYEQDGVAGLTRLAGGVAFALWDREEHELVLGRDRFGEKPLYVVDAHDRFAFASEMHALVPEAELDPGGVTAFLTLGFVPEPVTTVAGVRALAPGTIVRVRGRAVREESLWGESGVEPSGDRDADRARFGRLLREAVQTAVRGEEEVGVILDGNVPSTALLALVRPHLGRGLGTHVFDFAAPAASKRLGWRAAAGQRAAAAARASNRSLAHWFQSEHREHSLMPQDVAAAFDTAAEGDRPSIGAPFAQLAAGSLRACGERIWLSPLAVPALLGPARTPLVPSLWRIARHRPTRLLGRAAASIGATGRPFARSAAVSDYLGRRDSVAAAYLAARGVLSPRGLAQVVRPDTLAAGAAAFDAVAYLDERALRPPGPRLTAPVRSARMALACAVGAVELAGPTLSGALRDLEEAALGHGLALRTPFLDHRIFEWAANGALDAQAPLRDMVRGVLPRPLAARLVGAPPPPLAAWMRTNLRSIMETHLFGDDPEGLFARDGVERLWRGFLRGRVNWLPVWSVATLRAWIGVRRASGTGRSERSGLRGRRAA